MNKLNQIIRVAILCFFIFAPMFSIFPIFSGNIQTDEEQVIENSESLDLRTSDVAGTDLYAEQISAYIAGSESIIRQSLFDRSHFECDFIHPVFFAFLF